MNHTVSIFILILIWGFPSVLFGQGTLFDGMYGSEWVAERDALIGLDQQRKAWMEDSYYESMIKGIQKTNPNSNSGVTIRHQNGIQITVDTPSNTGHRKGMSNTQREAIRKRNRDIEQRNFYKRRRAEREEAARRAAEREAKRREEERQKQEQIRRDVTARTYAALERQTKVKQDDAHYRTHEGAYELAERHNSKNLTNITEENKFGNSRFYTGPRKNFTHSLRKPDEGGLVIDPNKTYHLATWDNTPSEDLSFIDKPMLSFRGHQILDDLHSSFKEESGKNILEIISKEPKSIDDLQLLNQYNDYKQSQLKEVEKVKDMAILSSIVYVDCDLNLIKETPYRLTTNEQIDKNSPIAELFDYIDKANNTDNQGFHAELYFNKQSNEYSVVFRGTETRDPLTGKMSFADAIVDGAQSMGYSSKQYEKAIEIGNIIQKLNKEHGAKINITGHSLGGGLATVAGVISGSPTLVFNPAGVHEDTFKKAGVLEKVKKGEYNITYVSEQNDLLTNSQESKKIGLLTNSIAHNLSFRVHPKIRKQSQWQSQLQ